MPSWILQRKSLLMWLLLTATLGGWLTHVLLRSEDKTVLLPGITTDGHHQIEMACTECHTDEKTGNIFTSSGVTNTGCLNCHADDLAQANDSHPVRKFKNPENAVFLQHIDAMLCVTCHQEHNHKITGEMAVTVPADYCAHCHEVTLENLESHRDLEFNTCATSGCHNFHDNLSLAPSFLRRHYGQPDLLATRTTISDTEQLQRWLNAGNQPRTRLEKSDADAPAARLTQFEATDDWHASAHAKAGINCSDCHESPSTGDWIERPDHQTCKLCHHTEVNDFTKGKHGMRLAIDGLSPMTPELARIPMHAGAAHRSLTCNSCHPAHRDDRAHAAYQACVACHASEHTRNYENSHHHALWQAELTGAAPAGAGVSCASCHMPREKRSDGIVVNHNQSANLRPNEKMLKNVCMNCHGMQFGMDALSEPELIRANFSRSPSVTHPGIRWTVESAIKRGDEKTIELHKKLTQSSQPDGSIPSTERGSDTPEPSHENKETNR